MKPEEKANELIEKFSYYSFYLEYRDAEEDMIKNAKQCCLIAVDEILLIADIMDVCGVKEKSYEYWEKVKTEIEKL